MKIVTTIFKVVSFVTGLAAYNDMIPAKFAPISILVFALASIAKDAVRVIGDWMDDKQLNQSYKP